MHVTRSSPHAAAMSRHHHSRTHDDALLTARGCERASRAAGAVVAYGAGLGRGACPHTPVDAANRIPSALVRASPSAMDGLFVGVNAGFVPLPPAATAFALQFCRSSLCGQQRDTGGEQTQRGGRRHEPKRINERRSAGNECGIRLVWNDKGMGNDRGITHNQINWRLCAEEHERQPQERSGDSKHTSADKRRSLRAGERAGEYQGAKGKHDHLIERDVERGPVGQHDGCGWIMGGGRVSRSYRDS